MEQDVPVLLEQLWWFARKDKNVLVQVVVSAKGPAIEQLTGLFAIMQRFF
jgi:hypothetical protein